MLLSPKSKQKLVDFSLRLERAPSTLAPIDQQTRLQIVQKEWLQGEGLDIIPELMHNSQKTLDASTGSSAFAPPEKIEDELLAAKSSQLPEYHNHLPQEDLIKVAQKYFEQIGVLNNTTKLKQDIYDAKNSPNDYFCVIGHGTTHLFTSSLKSILKTKGDVIIVTQPSYGLFLGPIENAQGVIEPLVLNQQDKFKPNPNELKKVIAKINSDRKEKYFQLIQHKRILLNNFILQVKICQNERTAVLKLLNDLSIKARDLKNTDFTAIDSAMELYHTALRSLIQKTKNLDEVSMWYETLSLPLCQRVRGYFHMNPHMPMGTICEQKEINKIADAIQPFSDVQVIDDLTYYDLVLPDTKSKPGTFAQSSLKTRSLTLYSLSKQFALASVRAGIALGPKHLIAPICKDIFDSNNTPNIFTRDAFYSILNWPQNQRNEYLSETKEEYTKRRDLTLALIQGQQNLSKASLGSVQNLLTQMGISLIEQKGLLTGITGLKTLVKPESGYFVIIDFSHYQDQYLGTTQLNQSRDFRNAFYRLADVNTIPGEMMYMFDKPVLRFSYSMTPKEILDSILRIKSVLSLCQPKPMAKKEIEAIKKASSQKASSLTKPMPAPEPRPEKEVTRVYLPKYHAHLENKERNKQSTAKKNAISLPKASLHRKKGQRKIKPSKLLNP